MPTDMFMEVFTPVVLARIPSPRLLPDVLARPSILIVPLTLTETDPLPRFET